MPTLLQYWRCDDDSGTTMSEAQGSPAKDGKYANTVALGTTGPLPSDPNNTVVTLDGVDGVCIFNWPEAEGDATYYVDNDLSVNPDEGSFLFWAKLTRPSTDFTEYGGTQRFEELFSLMQTTPHFRLDFFRSIEGTNDIFRLWRKHGGGEAFPFPMVAGGGYVMTYPAGEEVLLTATVNPIISDEWVAFGLTWSASAGTIKLFLRRDGTTTAYEDIVQHLNDGSTATEPAISAFGSLVSNMRTYLVQRFESYPDFGTVYSFVPPKGALGQFKHYGTALTQTEIEQEWVRWDYTDIPYGTADFAQLQFIPSAIQGRTGVTPYTLYWVRNGELVDLTDCTSIIGRIKPRWGTTRFVSGLISVDADPTSGKFTFLPSSDDVQSAGDYKVEFVASFPDGNEAMIFDWSIRVAT